MFNLEIWKIIVAAVIAVLSWIVAHRFNTIRDRDLKRRELITSHLIGAYRILANDITRREASNERDLKLETVISELQLFGSERQIFLTKKLADDVTKGGDFYVDDLINELRHDLRKQLNLTPVEGNVKWLRFEKNKFDKI